MQQRGIATFSWRSGVPRGPHLHKEEGRPAHDVGHHYDERHFHGANLSLGDEPDAAHPRQEHGLLACPRIKRRALSSSESFHPEVLPYFKGDQAIADAQYGDRNDVNGEAHPRDVSLGAPRLNEFPPAVVHPFSHLPQGEDVDLRGAERQA